VVMDEATSALDERSDRQLLSLLRAKLPNTAFLIISHRRPKGMGDFMTVDLSQPPIRNRPYARRQLPAHACDGGGQAWLGCHSCRRA
jgi:hypothetical protein